MRYPVKVDRKHINIATFNKRFHLKEKYFHINTRLTKLLISYVSFLYPIAFIQYYANIWNRVRESFLLHDVHYYMYDIVWSYSFHKNHGFYIHIRLGNLGDLISYINFFTYQKHLINFALSIGLLVRLCNLEDLKLYIDIFNDIGVPRLGTWLIMNKNGLLFPMCSSMTWHRPQTSLDSR